MSPPNEIPTLPVVRAVAGAIPRWKLDDLVTRPCPICDADASSPVCQRPDTLTVERCRKCGMYYIRRIPSPAQLDHFYANYAAFKGYARPKGRPARRLPWLRSALACSQNTVIEILETSGGINGRTVLDFGCSTGHFLELTRWKGGLPHGIEIDPTARAEAHAVGLTVTEHPPEGQTFDIVCAQQLLEHLASPKEMVSTIARTVARGGRVLISVPNGGEIEWWGPSWIGFRVDLEHLNFFRLQDLIALLQQANLSIDQAWFHRQPNLVSTDGPAVSLSENLRVRVFGLIERAARVCFPAGERATVGSFNLTVLARRVETVS